MPELPEIEIIKEEAKAQLVGLEVARVLVKERGKLDGEELLPQLVGTRVSGAQRRGKMLILEFARGVDLVIHLMLIGQVLLHRGRHPEPGHSTIALLFTNGDSLEVWAVGLQFQHLVRHENLEKLPEVANLGVDALNPEFTPQRLGEIFSGRRGAIKPLLMEQSNLSGLGNTYTDEVLHLARLHPQRDLRSLRPSEVAELHAAIVAILHKGLALGGYSGERFVHLDGSPGRFQEETLVVLREGQPCQRCGATIEKTRVGGRQTFICPHCQSPEAR